MKELFTIIVVLVVGCSGLTYNASSYRDIDRSENNILNLIQCNEPMKEYGDETVDMFLEKSYVICGILRKSQELSIETEWVLNSIESKIDSTKLKSNTDVKEEIINMIHEITDEVITESYPLIRNSQDASKSALSLKGLDKIRAEKDIAKAKKNLVHVNKISPIVLNYMNALLTKL